VVVLPPTRADGAAMGKLFAGRGIEYSIVASVTELSREIDAGLGSIIVSEEALIASATELLAALARQPIWSDVPILVLSRAGRDAGALEAMIPSLGNISVVERPIRSTTLISLVGTGHRARERQYQIRDYLSGQKETEIEREQLLASERSARGEAERSSMMKDEFLATLSHELRTPLNAVLGWTHVLRRIRGLPDEVAKGLDVIDRNARSQAQIIEDLLDMSSIVSGKVRLNMRRVDLGGIVAATVESIRPTADAREIQLQVVAEPQTVCVRGDPSRLQQVFWNLLTNAVKFTPRSGQISVSVIAEGARVEVNVTDNGEGIDPVFLPHVFDKFRQADASTSRRHGGLGLGLSIVKQLVELHGGKIGVTSAGTGAGSTFKVALPVLLAGDAEVQSREQVDAPSHDAEPEESQGVSLAGLTLLVVDDERDSRSLVRRVLEDRHARVVTAGSAEEAIGSLLEVAPDALISDIGMPGEDGYSMIRRIRTLDHRLARVPAIALTAYARGEDRAKATRAGFQRHLSKPVEPAELIKAIVSVVRRAD